MSACRDSSPNGSGSGAFAEAGAAVVVAGDAPSGVTAGPAASAPPPVLWGCAAGASGASASMWASWCRKRPLP